MEILVPAIITILLFNVLQRMEDWLHQHVFKVGWLVTKNFQTTTILYYTFFLPGVVLYELVRYLVAGALDVRAERAIAFPESQDIAELKLNFIKLSRKAPPWKVFIIQAAPPIVGLLVIYFIAVNVFDVQAIFATLAPATFDAAVATFTRLITIPDFWIWAYLVFTISGVTIPNWIVISGWRSILITAGGVAGVLFLIGVGENASAAITPSIVNGLTALSLLFGLMMILNGIGTLLLSAVEHTIERVTGDSATFRNGKLIALRRTEIRAMRQQERERALKVQQQKREKPALPAGPPSIYRMPLAIPGPPGDEIITRAAARIIEPEERPSLPIQGRRQEPTQISGEATVTSSTPTAAPTPPPPVNRPPPLFNPSRASSRIDDDDDDIDDEEDEDIEIGAPSDDDDSDDIVVQAPPRSTSIPISRPSPFLRSADEEDEDAEEDDTDTDSADDESSDEPVYEDVDDPAHPDDDEDDSISDDEDEPEVDEPEDEDEPDDYDDDTDYEDESDDDEEDSRL